MAEPTGKSPFLTLCTFAADLTDRMATLQRRDEPAVHVPLRRPVAQGPGLEGAINTPAVGNLSTPRMQDETKHRKPAQHDQ
jgi:hypothetical protein